MDVVSRRGGAPPPARGGLAWFRLFLTVHNMKLWRDEILSSFCSLPPFRQGPSSRSKRSLARYLISAHHTGA